MRKVAVLGSALMGVMAILSAMNLAFFPIAMLEGPERAPLVTVILSYFPFVTALAIGLVLLLARESVARWWFPEPEPGPALALTDALRGGLVLLGIFMLAGAVPTLLTRIISPITQYAQYGEQFAAGGGGPDLRGTLLQGLPAVIGSLAAVGIGWYLVARASQLAHRIADSSPGEPGPREEDGAS